MESRKFHSTSIVFEDNGLMILGKSGSGKSDLALRLIDSGATLISDDITICRKINSQIFLFSPEETKGLLEVREVGVITVPYVENIRLNLIARLVDEEITRMPKPENLRILGIKIPKFRINGRNPSSIVKVKVKLNEIKNWK